MLINHSKYCDRYLDGLDLISGVSSSDVLLAWSPWRPRINQQEALYTKQVEFFLISNWVFALSVNLLEFQGFYENFSANIAD